MNFTRFNLGLLALVLLAAPLFAHEDEAHRLLKKFRWTVEAEQGSSSLNISKKANGNPETFYQAASQRIGFDLRKVSGQELTVRSFLLKERGKKEGSEIYAHIAEHAGKVVGAWLSTNAPIAPGISSLGDRDFHDNL